MRLRRALGPCLIAVALLAGCAGRSEPPPSAPVSGAAAASVAPDAGGPSAASGRPAPPRPTRTPVAIKLRSTHVGRDYVTYTKRSQDNRKIYALIADSETGQYLGNDSGTSTFTNPHVTFYARDGQRLAAVAPTGTIVEKDKTIVMSGGVTAHTSDGKTLTSDSLRYVDDTETVYGNGNVFITTRRGDRLQGDSLVWNLRSGKIDIGRAL